MSDQPARRSTDQQRPMIPWAQAGVLVTVLGVLAAGLAWVTGGLHPQWQNDISALRDSNAQLTVNMDKALLELKNAQIAATAAAASDRAALAARLDSDRQLFTSRLDAMWRPSDYTDRDTHLSRLDAVYSTLRDQVRDQANDIKDLDKRLTGLSVAPVRNPGR